MRRIYMLTAVCLLTTGCADVRMERLGNGGKMLYWRNGARTYVSPKNTHEITYTKEAVRDLQRQFCTNPNNRAPYC